MKHFEDKHRNSEIPYNPELVDKYNPQIKIKGSGNKCSITFKLYEKGFVLIQGNSFISWCNNDFLKVLHNINSQGSEYFHHYCQCKRLQWGTI